MIPFGFLQTNITPPSPPVLEQVGASLGGNNKWLGWNLANDGKLYAPNFSYGQNLQFNPADNTNTYFASADVSLSSGSLASTGFIYNPKWGSGGQKIDPTVPSATVIAGTGGSQAFFGSVLAPNGKIYSSPHDSANIMVLDPTDDSIVYVASGLSNNDAFYGGVLAENGKIYFIPHSSNVCLVIDPATHAVYNFSVASIATGNTKWSGGVLALDGKIYCAPQSATDCLIIDPSDDSLSSVYIGQNGFKGCCLTPDGRIAFAPNVTGKTSVSLFNPVTSTYDLLPITAGYEGVTMAQNGALYFCNRNALAPKIAKLSNVGTVTSDMYTMPSPLTGLATSLYNKYQNKY